MKKILVNLIPLGIGVAISLILYLAVRWWGFLLIFSWIGLSISVGLLVAMNRKGMEKDLGRKLAILLISPVFLLFLGMFQHENLQLEETVFYALLFLSTGIFTRVLIHYAVAKIAGPFIWGRGFCGWACWTAAVLDWLPVKGNNAIPAKYGNYRYLSLGVSLAIPVLFIALGYDFVGQHLQGNEGGIFQTAKQGQLIWFLVGNGIYYALSVPMAFLFKKKRAFCKILCPVSLVMKTQSTVALIRRHPTENECVACGICNNNCPMDVDIVGYIKNKKSITSGECIQCCICVSGCPQNAIK